jgi:hypothetical protein
MLNLGWFGLSCRTVKWRSPLVQYRIGAEHCIKTVVRASSSGVGARVHHHHPSHPPYCIVNSSKAWKDFGQNIDTSAKCLQKRRDERSYEVATSTSTSAPLRMYLSRVFGAAENGGSGSAIFGSPNPNTRPFCGITLAQGVAATTDPNLVACDEMTEDTSLDGKETFQQEYTRDIVTHRYGTFVHLSILDPNLSNQGCPEDGKLTTSNFVAGRMRPTHGALILVQQVDGQARIIRGINCTCREPRIVQGGRRGLDATVGYLAIRSANR